MRFLFALFYLSTLSLAAQTQPCDALIRSLVYFHQRGSLGLDEYQASSTPVDTAFKKIAKADRPTQEWKEVFYDDVMDFLSKPATEEDWKSFETKYGFNHDDALDVLTYYASRHYFAVLPNLGPVRQTLQRLSERSRQHRLGEPKDELSRKYPYYLFSLTQKSVPELAKEQGLSESKVYQELSALRLSIEEEFNLPLSPHALRNTESFLRAQNREDLVPEIPKTSLFETAKRLQEFGLSTGNVSRILGIGRQALDFLFHFENEKNRGVKWDRKTTFEGKALLEEKILSTLWNRDLTSQEIADTLNQLFRTENPEHANYRTQGSVSAKARLLGLSETIATGPDISHPVYGELKRAGELVSENVIAFIYDHYDRPLTELATTLDMTPAALKAFLKRHDLLLLPTATRRIVPLLPKSEVELFIDQDTGILTQLIQSTKGMSQRTDKTLLQFAKEQVTAPTRQTELVSEIEQLNLSPRDGNSAGQGRVAPASRIHAALKLIAEAKTGKQVYERLLTADEGTRIFGLPPIRTIVSITQLSKEDLAHLISDDTGVLPQLIQSTKGMRVRTDRALIQFAKEQVPDPNRQNDLISEIEKLNLSPHDGGSAKKGQVPAASRIHAALKLIAEAKTGIPMPEPLVTAAAGTRIFGLPELKAIVPLPQLSKGDLAHFINHDTGILSQLIQNIKGMSVRTGGALIQFAKEQVADPTRLKELVLEIEKLRLSPTDGSNAKQGQIASSIRIHATLKLIAEAKTGLPLLEPLLTADTGTRIFGFGAIVPQFSKDDLERFICDDAGILSQLIQSNRGMSSRANETLIQFAKEQVPDPAQQKELLSEIEKLRLSPHDGSNAKKGINHSASRIHAALKLIAEAKSGQALSEPILTSDQGRSLFGLK